jgi:hypothetical protein
MADRFPSSTPPGLPPDGYVIAFDAADGYYIARPSSKILILTNPTVPGAGSYSVTVEDVALITHAGTGTINLPTSPPTGTVVQIKDFSGNCATQNLTVSTAQQIDGSATYVINTNFGSVRAVFAGATWAILDKF